MSAPSRTWSLHDYQERAVDQILDAFRAGYRNVLLDAPTGSGKTFIANAVLEERGGAFSAASLTLQQQYARDFPEVRVLQGHANYCSDHQLHSTVASGEDCHYGCTEVVDGVTVPYERSAFGIVRHYLSQHEDSGDDPDLRRRCRYACEKALALNDVAFGGHVNSNPWYLGGEQQGPNELSGLPLVVVDEADEIESVADTVYSRSCGVALLREFGWDEPVDQTAVSRESLTRSVQECLAEAERQYGAIRTELHRHLEALTLLGAARDERAHALEARSLRLAEVVRFLERFVPLLADETMVTTWDDARMEVRAVRPGQALEERFWPNSEHRLLMSGSFCDPLRWARWVGLEPAETTVITVPSRFPAWRSPITVWRGGPVMTGRAFDDPDKVRRLVEAIELYRTGRCLVHVASGRQAQILARYLPDAITYRSGVSGDRDRAVREFLARPDSLLIGQSLRRGLDLADDACRSVIVAKLPFRQLDRVTRARKAADASYYARLTASELTQGLGRAMRHADDWCYSYVLDGSFSRPLERMLPPHLRASIVN